MKKLLIFFLSSLIVLASIMPMVSADSAAAGAANPEKQLEQLVALGVFSKNTAGDLEAKRTITREEFAKVILYISGQESKAALYKNNSLFKDVQSTRWSNGYIGAANALGYLKGMPDGLYHPTEAITYAQAVTVFGKLLKYADADLSGNWPYNYFTLMENLGVLEGVSYKPEAPVSRENMAVMLQRLLQSEIKDGTKLFVDTTGMYQNALIFENGNTRKDLDANRVLTQSGTYYLASGVAMPEAGKQYVVRIEKGVITKLALCDFDYENISVKSISSGTVIQNNGNVTKLPQNVDYYYNGKAVDFGTAAAAVSTNSSIVAAYQNGEAKFAVLLDPVYSTPKIVTSQMLGYYADQLCSGKTVTRAGKNISPSMLEINDVLYEATDIWGKNGYIDVYNNETAGAITAILPNKVTPSSVSVDGKSYELSSFFPKYKVNITGALEVDSRATLLLGRDGKAVDIILSGTGVNEDYVLVLDAYSQTSLDIKNFGDTIYYVNLLHTDGSIKTYVALADESSLKGALAKYMIVSYGTEYDTVSVNSVDTTQNNSFSYEIKKDQRILDGSYVADNVVIFNQINNISGQNNDASVLRWSHLPAGRLEMGKIKYIHRTGDFGDIDVLFVDNILDEQCSYGVVTSLGKSTVTNGVTIYSMNVMVKGKEYTYSTSSTGLLPGAVLKLKMSNDKILTAEKQLTAVSVTNIDAIDSSRIRFNGMTYSYHSDMAAYKLEQGVTWTPMGISKLSKGPVTGTIEVYLDKNVDLGGKVVMILVR